VACAFYRVHRAGPRKEIYYEPEEVKAAIVTCGGLCPGLNDVIRQVLFFQYYSRIWFLHGIADLSFYSDIQACMVHLCL
jgi:hypothetical protein